jgi:hypothetical protein
MWQSPALQQPWISQPADSWYYAGADEAEAAFGLRQLMYCCTAAVAQLTGNTWRT